MNGMLIDWDNTSLVIYSTIHSCYSTKWRHICQPFPSLFQLVIQKYLLFNHYGLGIAGTGLYKSEQKKRDICW